MRYGMILPGGRAADQLEQAVLAEERGWDAVFVWEAAYGVDAWSLLAAMATRTQRIRLGTLLTPLPWRRPWKVASQVATVDQLSGGRAILTVGLGAVEADMPRTGEVMDLRRRAELLDEGIELIRELWGGASSHHGRHYDYEGGEPDHLSASARPVQERIPIWVVAAWRRPKSLQRALRCDGVVPQYQVGERQPTPEDARALCAFLAAAGRGDLEVVAEGETPADDAEAAAARAAAWAEAGCTWWLETRWEVGQESPQLGKVVQDRLAAGPPSSRT